MPDTAVVEDTSLDDLDPRLVDRFVRSVDDRDRTAALVNLDMVAEDEAGVLRPTIAGLLFGTRWPQRWLPQAFIQSVAYRGDSVSAALRSPRYQLDAKDNDGPIDDQIEYACRFVARNQWVEASKHMGRRDWPQYDLAALFEAVVNAVAHRDYSIRGSKVRLRMFSDRIEVYSPGALPDSIERRRSLPQTEREESRDRQPPGPVSRPGGNREPPFDADGLQRRRRTGNRRAQQAAFGQGTCVRAVRQRVAIDDLRGGAGR